MTQKDVTVQIMLGGLSKRMGRDKALVELGGKTLLDRAVETWKDYGSHLCLSVGAAERKALAPEGVESIADVYPERGPLGGLQAGLKACKTPYLLLVAVDCPFLGPEQADVLMSSIGKSDACVYELEGHPQPLFGLYRRRCAGPAETLILSGDNRMSRLLDWAHTKCVPVENKELFRNLNTPEDLAEAQKMMEICK